VNAVRHSRRDGGAASAAGWLRTTKRPPVCAAAASTLSSCIAPGSVIDMRWNYRLIFPTSFEVKCYFFLFNSVCVIHFWRLISSYFARNTFDQIRANKIFKGGRTCEEDLRGATLLKNILEKRLS